VLVQKKGKKRKKPTCSRSEGGKERGATRGRVLTIDRVTPAAASFEQRRKGRKKGKKKEKRKGKKKEDPPWLPISAGEGREKGRAGVRQMFFRGRGKGGGKGKKNLLRQMMRSRVPEGEKKREGGKGKKKNKQPPQRERKKSTFPNLPLLPGRTHSKERWGRKKKDPSASGKARERRACVATNPTKRKERCPKGFP